MDNRENVRKESKKAVLIIIPAYNEEKNIVPLLEKLEQPEITQFADVLVVNDASQDETNHVSKKRNHTVITNVFNLGYGAPEITEPPPTKIYGFFASSIICAAVSRSSLRIVSTSRLIVAGRRTEYS